MIEDVLCAIDLADPAGSALALRRAGVLATAENARLTVLTVTPDFGAGAWAEMFAASPMKAAMDQAARMLEGFVEKTMPGVKAARYMAAHGDPAEKIPACAAEAGADLVVLGPGHAEVAAALAREGERSVYLARR